MRCVDIPSVVFVKTKFETLGNVVLPVFSKAIFSLTAMSIRNQMSYFRMSCQITLVFSDRMERQTCKILSRAGGTISKSLHLTHP